MPLCVCSVREIGDILEAEEQEDDRKIKMKAREALKKASAEGKVCILYTYTLYVSASYYI